MAKPEWGTKRMCPSCGQRFYDLNKSPMTCPSCEAEFSPDDFVKTRRGKATPTAAAPKPDPAKAESEKLVKTAADDLDDKDVDDDDKALDDDDDDADSVIEDTSDLGEDDDDLNEVREHIESDDDKKDI